VIDWLFKEFHRDPAGWLSFVLAIAALVVSAVFWRRVWAFLRWTGRMLRQVARLRVTTVDRLPRKASSPIRPVRWDVTRFKGAGEHEFVLANWGEGSTARNVQLEAHGDGVKLRSGAFWEAIDGGSHGKFLMITGLLSFYLGVTFTVSWTDERGQRQSDFVVVKSDY